MDLQQIVTLTNIKCQQIFNDVSAITLEMSLIIMFLSYFAMLAMRFFKDI